MQSLLVRIAGAVAMFGGLLASSAARADFLSVGTLSGNILTLSPTGTVSTFATGFGFVEGLAFDGAGNLYVSNGIDSISKVTPGGAVSTFATGFVNPYGLAFDNSGNLYVTNSRPQFSTSGSVIKVT